MELYIVYNCSLERTVLHEYSYIYFVLIWIACAGFLMQRNKADSGISVWAAFIIGALMKREWAFKFHSDSFLIHQKHSFTLDFAWKWQSRGPHGYSSPRWKLLFTGFVILGLSLGSLITGPCVSHLAHTFAPCFRLLQSWFKVRHTHRSLLKQPRIPGTGYSSTEFWHHPPAPLATPILPFEEPVERVMKFMSRAVYNNMSSTLKVARGALIWMSDHVNVWMNVRTKEWLLCPWMMVGSCTGD